MIRKLNQILVLALILVSLAACAGAVPTPAQAPTVATIDPLETGPVVILVIDDFWAQWDSTDPPEGSYCVVTPDGQRADSGGVGTGPDGMPHGEMVYQVLHDEICGQFDDPTDDLSGRLSGRSGLAGVEHAELWDLGGGDEILLVGLDTLGFTTDIVTQRITETIDFFDQRRWGLQPARRFVLNMSFAVIPCKWLDPNNYTVDDLLIMYQDVISDDIQYGYLEDELRTIAGEPDEQTQRDALLDDTFGGVRLSLAYPAGDISDEGDPLGILLRKFEEEAQGGTPDKRVISIAAAGNSRYKFPFAPALWDSVVSVSALDEDYLNRGGVAIADYSNYGEVAMEGDYMGFEGTSYAAPRLSFQAARYLLDGGTVVCTGTLQVPTVPPMAYAEQFATPPGPWDNLPLRSAAHEYCTGFPH